MKDNLYHESHLVIYKKADYCWISPLLHYSILCIPVTCHLSVRFNPNQMMPENGMISNETCTRFVADQDMQKEQYSSFRIDIPVEKLDFINVTVLGKNITCGYDLMSCLWTLLKPQPGKAYGWPALCCRQQQQLEWTSDVYFVVNAMGCASRFKSVKDPVTMKRVSGPCVMYALVI